MAKINIKLQIMITVVMVTAGFVLSSLCRKEIFYNLAWLFCGLLFAANPVYPKNIPSTDPSNIEKGIRIAGLIIIFIGLSNGFGV